MTGYCYFCIVIKKYLLCYRNHAQLKGILDTGTFFRLIKRNKRRTPTLYTARRSVEQISTYISTR